MHSKRLLMKNSQNRFFLTDIPFLTRILFREINQRLFILKSIFWGFLYLNLALLSTNYTNVFSILGSDYSLGSQISILWTLFWGSFATITPIDVVLLLSASLLFGTNLTLVFRKIKFLARQGSLKLTFGAGLITLVATGCASCGLSFISLFGLGGVVAILPFGGIELYVVSIIMLLLLLFYNLHSYALACKLKKS